MLAAIVGAAGFLYQVPASILRPTNVRWMMVGDRGASLAGWLFERQSPWTLPFGILHNIIPPAVTTVGYSDALPWIAVPAKLVSGWTPLPWQFSGIFLLASYVLQGVFGYLVLRQLGVGRMLGLVGTAFFATSPALLQRFEHISLSAHWEILAAWWLYLRPTPPRPGWRFVAPWLLLLAVTIPTYIYLALMVAALASAAYVRAVWVDRSLSWRTAGLHAAVAVAVVFGVLWIFGYFVVQARGDTGFGHFSTNVLGFFDSAGWGWIAPPLVGVPRGYENYYFLGLGVVVLLPIGVGLALAQGSALHPSATPGQGPVMTRTDGGEAGDNPNSGRRLWPGVAAALLMFAYAMATPITFAGHPILTVPLYRHLPQFTAWFRGSGRFAWPLYYLVMALVLATVARRARPIAAPALLLLALVVQLVDQRPLHAWVKRQYTYPWPRLDSPAWNGIGRSFRSIRLAPPIITHHVACDYYDQHDDYNTKFAVLASTQAMTFNSATLSRVDAFGALCRPMLDSLKRGLLDPHTVYVPATNYFEEIQWTAEGHVICGKVETDNVCIARDSATAGTAMARLLAGQSWRDSAHVLHLDLRYSDPPIVESIRGFTAPPDSGGRALADSVAEVRLIRPFPGAVDLVLSAAPAGLAKPVRLTIALGRQSQSMVLGPGDTSTTWRFDDKSGRIDPTLRLSVSAPPTTAHPTGAHSVPASSRFRLKRLTFRFRSED